MITKNINSTSGKKYEEITVPGIVYDDEPIEGSFNGITSDAVAKIAGGVADLDSIVPEGASEENKLATAADVAGVQEDVDTIEGKIPSDTSTTNKLVNESGLQDAIDNASESWSTGFTPKGESSVSDLNGLTAQSNGDSYIVTDSGTLTDGTLAVVAGDQVAWDATNSVWYKLPQYALQSSVSGLSASTSFIRNYYLSKQTGIVPNASTENLIIYDGIISGEYFDTNGKPASASASWWRSDLIPCNASTSYSAGLVRVLFFDAAGNYLSDNAAWGGTTFTTPADCAYMAISSNQSKDSAYLYLSSNQPGSWVKGEKLLTKDKIKDFEDDVAEAVSNSKKFVEKTVGTQLFDKSGVYTPLTTGQYVPYNTGTPTALETYEWFILPVTPDEEYTFSGVTNIHVAFFDAEVVNNSHYVDGNIVAVSGTTLTVPACASFMTVSFKTANASLLMVQKGDTATPYEDFAYGISTDEYLPNSITKDKLSEELRTSLNDKKIVTIGSTGCDYTNICTAIRENQSNTIFKLAAETFDVQAAYEEEYGASFFADYTRYSQHDDDPMYRGLNLGIGCELIGQPNTELEFLYSGDNTEVATYFSILSLTDNNLVSGVKFNLGGKLRYAIHDDYSTLLTGATNIVEHCVFKGTTSDSGRPYIGTGMGKKNAYIYRDCVFAGMGTRAIGLHNNSGSAMGRVEIYGCYCGQAIFIFHYGTSTAKTPVMIHDCKASSINLDWAEQSIYPNENMELFAWNNTTL